MLKTQLKAFIDLGELIHESKLMLHLGEEDPLTPEDMNDILENMDALAAICDTLDLPVWKQLILSRRSNSLKREAYGLLVDGVKAEIENRLFLYVPTYRAKYFESNGMVSDAVRAAFPLASAEIRAAGNCFALNQQTASVIHSMRAAEVGLRAMATALKADLPRPVELMEWQEILNAIRAAIEVIAQQKRSAQRDEDLEFYNEAAAQLMHFKHAWRNRGAHGAVFSEQQAKDVMDHVCPFFEILTRRLKE